MRAITLLVFLMLWNKDIVKCVHLTEVRIPAHAAAGAEVLLGCQFDMGDDILYSIKWYKDGKEFYRYVPKNSNPANHFPRPGIHVDLARSSSDAVTLVRLTTDSAGMYRCEASGEAPLFATAAQEKHLSIHVLPTRDPVISGLRHHYRIGDYLNTNCTSPGSIPEARLKWLVNNRAASRGDLRGPWNKIVKVEDMFGNKYDYGIETTLQLRFKVLAPYFKNGVMNVKCQATLAPLYQRETTYSVSNRIGPSEVDSVLSSEDEYFEQKLTQRFNEIRNTVLLEKPLATSQPENVPDYALLPKLSLLPMLAAGLIQIILFLL